MSTWMLYTLAIGSLLWVAGHCAERVALAAGGRTRWIWLATIAASTAVPLLLPAWNARYGTASREAGGVAGIGAIDVIGGVAPIDVPAAAPSIWLERALALGWGASSLALLVFFMASAAVLRRRRRRWPLRVLAGMPVLVSERTGPALVGFAAPDIVVPSWVLDWDECSLRLLVAHEREHERAGDPLLLLVAAAALVLLPWNLPLWRQVRRLRLAIEVDCDARVLRRHPDARRYGLLLLEVGALASRPTVPVAAFSEPSSLLERRMRVLSGRRRIRRPAAIVFVSTALAGSAAVAALPVPEVPAVPARVTAPAPPLQPAAAGRVAQPWEDAGGATRAIDTIPDPDRPGAVPYDEAPQLLREARERLSSALAREYPPQLRNAGVGGTVTLWVFVDASGRVAEARVASGSGHVALDSAAVRLAGDLAFAPAHRDGAAVPVWIQLPIRFSAGTGDEPPAAEQPHRVPLYTSPPGGRFGRESAPDTVDLAARPTFTPYEVRPEVRNREEVARLLERSFPPQLKDAGVRATAVFWVYIGEDGRVASVRLNESSGYEQIDEAARDVLLQTEFSPAYNQGRPVGAWIQLPVTFQAG